LRLKAQQQKKKKQQHPHPTLPRQGGGVKKQKKKLHGRHICRPYKKEETASPSNAGGFKRRIRRNGNDQRITEKKENGREEDCV
jgi:hypothetical protein